MIRATSIATLILGLPHLLVAQAPRGAEPDWRDLRMSAMERVAIDRATLRQNGSVRRADLRWNLVGTAGRFASYTVEDTEVDCAREQGRLHGRRSVQLTPHNGRTTTPGAVTPAEHAWHSYGPGSAGREAWRRMCEVPITGT